MSTTTQDTQQGQQGWATRKMAITAEYEQQQKNLAAKKNTSGQKKSKTQEGPA